MTQTETNQLEIKDLIKIL